MTRFSLALFLTSSFALYGQKKEDFVALQRDVAQMQDQMKQLQKSQDEKMGALTTLVQQSLDSQARIAAALAPLQQSLLKAMDDHQAKLSGPLVNVSTKVDNMSEEFRGVKESISALGSQLSKLDGKLTDISLAVRTLSAAPAVAPPAAPTAQQQAVVPQGPSADVLWENARRDMSAGKNQIALDEFAEYVKNFHDSENAPSAQYSIGTIYDRGEQYEDALKAFSDVLAFPENPRTPDALYMKGAELMKLDRNPEARTTFQDFLKRYPAHELSRKAQAHLRELAPGAARPATVHKKPPQR